MNFNQPTKAALCAVALVTFCLMRVSSAQAGSPTPEDRGSLLIGAFNVQVFGLSKMGKADVVAVLVKVSRRLCARVCVHRVQSCTARHEICVYIFFPFRFCSGMTWF